jgi:hypothetical protein
MTQSENHLRDEEVERYSLGEARQDEAENWGEHLLLCETCRLRVADSDAYVAAMRAAAAQLRQSHPPRERRWWKTFPGLLPAAAGLAALAVVVFVALPGNRRPRAPATVAVHLAATRGAGIEAQAPSGTQLFLQPDLAGLPELSAYRLEVVDSAGKSMWRGALPSTAGSGATVPRLQAGIYFVRVSSPAGDLYREYGLDVGK